MQIQSGSPELYIEQLPEDRKEVICLLRKAKLENLPKGFVEIISYGMLGYVVPHTLYPNGYHCDSKLPLPFMNLASQKNFIALYHMGIYGNKNLLDWFLGEYPKYCKIKPDVGKGCIRFKKMDQIPYLLIGELTRKITAEEWICIYEKKLIESKLKSNRKQNNK